MSLLQVSTHSEEVQARHVGRVLRVSGETRNGEGSGLNVATGADAHCSDLIAALDYCLQNGIEVAVSGLRLRTRLGAD
jgi:hypothetical protein